MKQQTVNRLQFLFRHFAMRLLERYGVLITFEEYVQLCKIPFIRCQKLKENGKNSYYKGNVDIKGVRVKVYRSTYGCKPFLTAIPINKNSKTQLNN